MGERERPGGAAGGGGDRRSRGPRPARARQGDRQPGRQRPRSRQRPSERSRRTDPARFAAYRVLRAVADGAYANLELPRVLRSAGLEGRDAAFATELAYGTLRMRGLTDAVIAVAADRPTSRIDGPVLDVLRLGTHQLLAMRVPPHAAADQTVALARSVAGSGAGGFVNAVMRRVSDRSLEQWQDEVVPEGPPAARLAVLRSHPEWVVKALRGALLGHAASTPEGVEQDLDALLVADNTPAPVTLVARPGLADVEELIAAGAAPGAWAPTAAVLDGGDPARLPAVVEGRAAVQDEGSQLVALTLASPVLTTGRTGDGPERWLDLCAGPGGKAGLLAALAPGRDADLTAVEVSEHRAELVRRTLRPAVARAGELGRTVTVRTGDGREVGRDEPGGYDRVLVDAPCTGLGALRRRPEARWRRSPADLGPLGVLQRELLASALDATAPGGVVGYATCSPHVAETTFVVGDVLKRRDDVEVLDARAHLAHVATGPGPAAGEGGDHAAAGDVLAGTGEGPHVQLWPHVHGTDGMFLALLRRTC